MKTKSLIISAFTAMAALSACTEDENILGSNGNQLDVSASIPALTRAAIEGTQLPENAQLGVSLFNPDGSDYDGKQQGYKNVLYKSELLPTGKVKWSSANPIILSPSKGKAVAYYPYSAAVADISAIPVETASQTDYLFSDPVEGLNSSMTKATFSMNHALCAVQINIRNDSYTQGPGNITRVAVASTELATAASLNSITGELSAFTGKSREIESIQSFTIGKEAHSTTIMAIPTGGQDNISIKVTLDGKKHQVTFPVKAPFVKGKKFVLDILVKDKTAPIEIVSVNVKPWIEEDLGEYPMEVGPYGMNDYAIEVTVADGATFTHNVREFTGTIDWGDGTQQTVHESDNNPVHTYTKAGKYKVIATGRLSALSPADNNMRMEYITDILFIGEEIGKGIIHMTEAFQGARITKIRSGIFDNCPNVTSFYGTFAYCELLTVMPAELFNKCSNLINFSNTFKGCSNIIEIPTGLFNYCSKVTNFGGTFSGCSALKAIPQGLFDNCLEVTSFGYNMDGGTFEGCTSLTSIPQGLFKNSKKAKHFDRTFRSCTSLTTIPQGLFNSCPNAASFSGAFGGCSVLKCIPQGLFDSCTKIKSFEGTFNDCSSLTTIPTGLFDNCPQVTTFHYTFSGCKALMEIPAGLFDNCPQVTSFVHTFEKCVALTAIPTGLFDNCPNATDFRGTFGNCYNIAIIPQGLFKKNTKVTTFGYTFIKTAITEIPKGLFDNCHLVENFGETFRGCVKIDKIPEGLFDSCLKVTDFSFAFSNTKITSIPKGLFDNCPNVTSFYGTFIGCSNIAEIPTGLFDNCSEVIDFSHTFSYCSNITEIPTGLFDKCTKVTSFGYCFNECSNLTTVPASIFDKCKKVNNFTKTFFLCGNIENESPYTMIDNKKVHLYERNLYPELFTTPTAYENAFRTCAKLIDYNEIPYTWGGEKK